MERRIKLTDEDIGIIVNSLSDSRDNAIAVKRESKATDTSDQDAYIDRIGMILGDFQSRLEEG